MDVVVDAGIIADNFADEIILEPHEIARRYVRTWFLLDLVSSIPLDYFILLFSPDASLSQLLHAGILQLIRAGRFLRID